MHAKTSLHARSSPCAQFVKPCFHTQFGSKWWKCRTKVLFCRFQQFLKLIKGIVKRAEPCKCDVLFVSRIIWHKRITPFFKRMDIFMFYTHWQLSVIIVPFKFTQCHSSEGYLFSLEKTCDLECCKPIRSKFLWKLILSIKFWRTKKLR